MMGRTQCGVAAPTAKVVAWITGSCREFGCAIGSADSFARQPVSVLVLVIVSSERSAAHFSSCSDYRVTRSGSQHVQANCSRREHDDTLGLVGRPPTREVEYGARAERALIAGEPTDERGRLFDRAESPERNFGQHEVDVLRRHLIE